MAATEWRECVFGPDKPENPFHCRQCYLNVRRIVYGNIPDGIFATRARETCATCPTPALVEAVKAWSALEGMTVAGVPRRYDDDFQKAIGLNRAALAMLPKPEVTA